jgi:hypothetical protein
VIWPTLSSLIWCKILHKHNYEDRESPGRWFQLHSWCCYRTIGHTTYRIILPSNATSPRTRPPARRHKCTCSRRQHTESLHLPIETQAPLGVLWASWLCRTASSKSPAGSPATSSFVIATAKPAAASASAYLSRTYMLNTLVEIHMLGNIKLFGSVSFFCTCWSTKRQR